MQRLFGDKENQPLNMSKPTPRQVAEFNATQGQPAAYVPLKGGNIPVYRPEETPRQHILKLGWETIHTAVDSLAFQLQHQKIALIVGVARGGLIPATLLAHKLNLKVETIRASSYEGTRRTLQKPVELEGWSSTYEYPDVLIVDDIVDTGDTLTAIRKRTLKTPFVSLVTKRPVTPELYFARVDPDVWVVFPWEEAPK